MSTQDETRRRVLVDADELARLLADDEPPALLDVRWALGRTDGHERYLAAHLPGAVYVDLDTELAAPPSPAAGRHPLPDVADLERAARRWGVREGGAVVVYDDAGGTSAARAWWLLRWAGVRDVRLLDGGLAAWVAAGYGVEPGDVTPEPGDVVLVPGALATVDADGAAALAADGVLLDARAAERYAGDVEPVDPRAGHVPGAVSAPTAANLDDAGRFLPADALRARFDAAGVVPGGGPVGVYCGSGVTAAHEVAALASVGVDAALYPGSWSQWSNDPSRPVATA
ncbi:sulfurtransferase [Cellulomonas sp. Sa3CUA2]|uniref:Sulfurtransferase n=1 Tax=Cellulomonas avistercoris TaxID=2762242 RepID=A0ABR8QD69_9CELL|nr:sulfurtransferase [Cellulomonas avistercoris]MBD7918360.1 sulfurtransferase [Cellulomonas avistercoris]